MASFRTSAAGGGTTGTTDRTATITPAANDLLVVFFTYSGTVSTPTCSDGNTAGANNTGTYTLVNNPLFSASANQVGCFVRNQLVPNTTSTTVTVATGNNNTAGEIVIVAVQNALWAGLAGIRQFTSQANQAASTTPAPVFASSCLTQNVTLKIGRASCRERV